MEGSLPKAAFCCLFGLQESLSWRKSQAVCQSSLLYPSATAMSDSQGRKTEGWAQPRHQLTLQRIGQLGCTEKSRGGTRRLNTYAACSCRGGQGNLCGPQDPKRNWSTYQLQNTTRILWPSQTSSNQPWPCLLSFLPLYRPNNYPNWPKPLS